MTLLFVARRRGADSSKANGTRLALKTQHKCSLIILVISAESIEFFCEIGFFGPNWSYKTMWYNYNLVVQCTSNNICDNPDKWPDILHNN